ncbi:hypothetical protein QTI17_30320 [Variovorax sp. J31P179]|uniref:hypothetical protein n=1 Tax=Variovorax sp. J31P179 TaxID=3053508 RepID=UPI0025759743|nr:hypothetical protein [Variovorax sp. J31P179]MDM0084899.1 hypothetical protein [Variovorax sp. J31P179]
MRLQLLAELSLELFRLLERDPMGLPFDRGFFPDLQPTLTFPGQISLQHLGSWSSLVDLRQEAPLMRKLSRLQALALLPPRGLAISQCPLVIGPHRCIHALLG